MNVGKYQFRYQIIKLMDRGLYTALDAAWELNLSIRHVRRLVALFRKNKRKKNQALLFKPKTRGAAWNGKTTEVVTEAVKLKRANPARSNEHIAELVAGKLLVKVSRSTIRNILIRQDCYEQVKRERRTFLKLEEKITHSGQMVQFDVCEGAWLRGYRRVYLIAFWTPTLDTSWAGIG